MIDSFKLVYRSRFFSELWPNRLLLLLSAIVMGLQAVVVVLSPIPLKLLIDDLLLAKTKSPWLETLRDSYGFGNGQLFWILVGALLGLAVINSVLNYCEEVSINLAGGRIFEGLRKKMVALLLSRTLAGLERRRKVDILGRLSSDTANLDIFISAGLSVGLRAIPTFLFILASMLIVDWHFSILVGAALPLIYWLASVYALRLRKQQKSYRVETNAFEQAAYQTIEAAPLLKSLAAETAVVRSLSRQAEHLTGLLLASRRSQGMLDASLGGSRNFLRIIVIVLGAYAGSRQRLSIGTLVMFLSYVDSLSKPINEVAQLSSKTTKALASLERVEQLFDELEACPEIGGPDKLAAIRNDEAVIELDRVSFAYPKGDCLLRSFSTRLLPGTLVAVLGASGSGKSTMTRLLNRLADPTAGAICLAGRDLRTMDLRALRNQVLVVQQELYLLHGTVRENLEISAVDERLSEARLWNALEHVNAADFVRALPQGLDTPVGEGCVRLSGGETRRLCLARAFVHAPAWVYVFDEPSSGLDPVSARIVMNSARELAAGGALVLWVTHRLEEVHGADSVVYFRAGSNPIHSNHAHLLASQNAYHVFFNELRAENTLSAASVLNVS